MNFVVFEERRRRRETLDSSCAGCAKGAMKGKLGKA